LSFHTVRLRRLSHGVNTSFSQREI
jgi:hypothetical protein